MNRWLVGVLMLTLAACGEDTSEADAGETADAAATDGDATVDGSSGGGDASADGVQGDSASGDTTSNGSNTLTVRSLHFTETLHAVWGSATDDVWWVGAKGRVLRYNGCTLAPRDAGTKADLFAVWGRSKSDVWIGGDGVVIQWDGKAFFDRTPSDLVKPIFRAAHAPTDGSTLLIAGKDGIVLRVLDDGKLKKESTNSGIDIHGIFAVSAGTVWAVGGSGQALRLSGGTWSETNMPKASGTVVAISGGKDKDKKTRLMAVGEGNYTAATADGTWEAGVTNDPKNRDLRGVWAVSGDEAWAVGPAGALIHLTPNNKWNVTDIDGTYMKTATFNAVWGIAAKDGQPAFAHAVGDAGAGLKFTDGKWLDFRAETTAHVRSVAVLPDGQLVATGADGLLMLAKDAQAEFVDLGAEVTCAALNDAADDGAGGAWAVGEGGVAVHVHKAGGLDVMVPAAAAGKGLLGIANIGKTEVIAVGEFGTVVRWTGTAWEAEKPGVQHTLHGIGSDCGKAWAVGDYGTILRREGGTWTKESTGVGAGTRLNSVVLWDCGKAVAVGDGGVVLERDAAGKWTSVKEEPGLFLYGVDRGADGRIVAVGWNGSLVVGKDGKYQTVASGVPNVLRDVAIGKDGIVAVGHKGGIYQVNVKALP